MKDIFIINKHAGKGTMVPLLEKKIHAHFPGAIIEYTKYAGHATELARLFSKKNEKIIIYACGGDGTINEVVNGIYGYCNVALAIIPIGTGNDFIKSLGYSKERLYNINGYLHTKMIYSDVIIVENHVALNIVTMGFDATVAKNVDKYRSLGLKSEKLPYYLSLIHSLMHSIKYRFEINMNNETYIDNYGFVSICNGQYYGGGYNPAPMAKIDDGMLDVIFIKNISRFNILPLSKHYEKGTHIGLTKHVQYFQTKDIVVKSKKPIFVNLDGEIIEMNNPHIKLVEKGIKIVIPK